MNDLTAQLTTTQAHSLSVASVPKRDANKQDSEAHAMWNTARRWLPFFLASV